MTHNFWAAPAVALLAGLVLLGAGAAEWVAGTATRDIGGVVVREQTGASGTTFAPLAVAFGLGGLFGGALLAVTRSGLRRMLGGVVAAAGAGGLAVVVAGTLEASAAEGRLTPAPFFAMTAAAAVAVAGVAALRGLRPAPPAASRYRVEDERPADDEWTLAAGEDSPRDGPPG